jgi:Spy/CpxP family protein refolding chaperone
MKLSSRIMIAAIALATPVFVAAQTPPAPGTGMGQGMGMQQRMGPGMGQQMGPGMGMQQHMGMRGQRGMKMRQGMQQRFVRRHPGMVMHRMMQDPAMRERLKITPDQVTKLQAHQSTMAKSMIRSHADIQVKRMELAELMRADKPDRVLIDKKLREVQDASFAAEKARIDSQLTVRDMFTPEQRQEMEKMQEEFRGPMMPRGPEGPGPGGMMGPRGQRPMGPPKAPPAQNPPPVEN